MNVLVVDDQRSARRVLTGLLEPYAGVTVLEAGTADDAIRLAREQTVDVAFIDLRLAEDPRDRGGLQVLAEVRARSTARAVMVTALSDLGEIRAAMRAGAYDYVLKEELSEAVVRSILEDARSRRRLEDEVLTLRTRARGATELNGLVGTSRPMQRLRELIQRVAVSERPALVLGPSGSGKEVVVQALHALGPAPEQPLLDLNCGAIPEPLVEAQLFGHERGAFTGADKKSVGYLTAVGKGTLFLDEIAELPLALQAKLLRVLETRRFRPVGSTAEQTFEGRVIAATHADLEDRVRTGRFREDLFHRLDVLRVEVPSLAERIEDLPALIGHFVKGQPRALRFTDDALVLMSRAPWTGNVRQLRNLIDRLAVLADEEVIDAATVERYLFGRRAGAQVTSGSSAAGLSTGQGGAATEASNSGAGSSSAAAGDGDPVRAVARAVLALPDGQDKLEAVERALVEEALSLTGGNKTAAARLLGVHRKVIERRSPREDGSGEST